MAAVKSKTLGLKTGEAKMLKKSRRGGRRPKRSTAPYIAKDGQRVLIAEIISALGGPTRAARRISEITQDEQFTAQNLINWRLRSSGAPIEMCFLVADALNISPFALNFACVSRVMGEKVSWREAVHSCRPLLSSAACARVLENKAPTVFIPRSQRK